MLDITHRAILLTASLHRRSKLWHLQTIPTAQLCPAPSSITQSTAPNAGTTSALHVQAAKHRPDRSAVPSSTQHACPYLVGLAGGGVATPSRAQGFPLLSLAQPIHQGPLLALVRQAPCPQLLLQLCLHVPATWEETWYPVCRSGARALLLRRCCLEHSMQKRCARAKLAAQPGQADLQGPGSGGRLP